ncbi:MAG: hypothetical protein MJZ99_04895 [Bacteroidales bacterium]|nr:hypothetical protein [Bacteroidales bacterium]
MKKDVLLKYFLFFDGSENCPYKNATKEAKIWGAERFIWDYHEIIDKSSPEKSIRSYIESFVGKWDPWGWVDVMEYYDSKMKEHGRR